MSPAVSTVNSTSLQRLRTRIFTLATPFPPTSCAASVFRIEGSLSRAMPQSPNKALLETLNRSPAGGWPGGRGERGRHAQSGGVERLGTAAQEADQREHEGGAARPHSPGTRKA